LQASYFCTLLFSASTRGTELSLTIERLVVADWSNRSTVEWHLMHARPVRCAVVFLIDFIELFINIDTGCQIQGWLA
jgi:hypothetical protein